MDTISDMLTRIRNGSRHKKEKVDIPSSRMKQEIARVLKEEGYIANYKVISDRKQGVLRIYLKYTPEKEPVLSGIKRVSRPGLRIYARSGSVPRILRGLGTSIVSTSKGVLTDRECRRLGVGGEVLLSIW